MADVKPQNRRKNGTFAPGCVANPGGRPAMPAEVKAFAQACSLDALKFIDEVMRDNKENVKYRLLAANTLLDRGYGKPAQSMDLNVSQMSSDERVRLIGEYQRIIAERTRRVPSLTAGGSGADRASDTLH